MNLSKKASFYFKKFFIQNNDSIKSKILYDFTILYIFSTTFIFSLIVLYNYYFITSEINIIYSLLIKLFVFSILFLFILRFALIKIIEKQILKRFNIYKNQMFMMINKNTKNRLTIFGSDEIDKLAFYTNNIMDKYDELLHLEKKNSLIDPLTLSYNRRALNLNFEAQKEKAQRKNYKISLALFDIDNFKKVNDIYGHDIGDKVLKNMVNVIKNVIRKYDSLYRFGGEEFIILFPDLKKKDVVRLLTRLQKEITYKLKKSIKEIEQPITVSGGYVSSKNYDILSATLLDDMIKKSDNLLYTAKKTGKNKIIIDK